VKRFDIVMKLPVTSRRSNTAQLGRSYILSLDIVIFRGIAISDTPA